MSKSCNSQGVDNDALRRVQLDLPMKAFDRLNQLKNETEARTYAEVMKNALKLYAIAIDMQKEGKNICIQGNDGKITPIFIVN